MEFLDHFELRDVGRRIDELETPVPLIDVDKALANLERWQRHCDRTGRAGRSHMKTHKLVGMAKAQLSLGAAGIAVQKLGEAEVMADAGIASMMMTFNVVGAGKLARLSALMRRIEISVVADNDPMIEGLAHAAAAVGRPLNVLVECDTGGRRNGVQTPQAAQELARRIGATPGLAFAGLLTHGRFGGRLEAKAFLDEARARLRVDGIEVPLVSAGGSPEMWSEEGLDGVDEYRVGTYVYYDRSQVKREVCTFDDCALTVLSTVVSTPTADRAIIDAGSKALTSDLIGLEGYGIVQDLGHAKVYEVNEEHGYLSTAGLDRKPRVGDRVRVTPNHACPVSNLFDEVVFVRGEDVLGAVRVAARGKVQ